VIATPYYEELRAYIERCINSVKINPSNDHFLSLTALRRMGAKDFEKFAIHLAIRSRVTCERGRNLQAPPSFPVLLSLRSYALWRLKVAWTQRH
jgi:hypothetical protein